MDSETQNVSGGPAIDVSYQFSIEGLYSGFNKDSSAIFPGAEVYMLMPKITGWKPEPNCEPIFEIRYKDIYGNSYHLQQKTKHPSFLLKYTSEPQRKWRNLCLKI